MERRLILVLREDELAAIGEIRRLGAFGSDADVVRAALWRYAEHFEVPLEPEAFTVGRQADLFDAAVVDEVQS